MFVINSVAVYIFLSTFHLPLASTFATALFGATPSPDFCNRIWPSLELLLPLNLNGNRIHEWKEIFLDSFLLFWPIKISKTKLKLLIDDEMKSEYGATAISNLLPMLKEKFSLEISISYNLPSVYYDGQRRGWNRQQMLMFYPENFSTSEFVGYVDTVLNFLLSADLIFCFFLHDDF